MERVEFLSEDTELRNSGEGFYDCFKDSVSPSSGLNLTPRPKGERVEFLSEGTELRNSGEGFYYYFINSVSPSSGFQPPYLSGKQSTGLFSFGRVLNGEGLRKNNQDQNIFTPLPLYPTFTPPREKDWDGREKQLITDHAIS